MPVGAGKRREDCYCSIAVLFCPGPGLFFPKLSPSPFPPLSASSHQIPPLPPSSLFPGRRETAKEIEDDD